MVRPIWSFGHGKSGIYKGILLSATDERKLSNHVNFDAFLGPMTDSKFMIAGWEVLLIQSGP